MHKYVSVSATPKRKPDTIIYYNLAKYGVDIVDQMVKKRTVRCAYRRWPMYVCFNVVDLACMNTWIIYREAIGKKVSRLEFI